MKVLLTEKEGEGLVGFLGKNVTIFCMNYFYHGELVGVNDSCVKLKDAYIVYETGSFDSAGFKDAQKIAPIWYVQITAIESFGIFEGKHG